MSENAENAAEVKHWFAMRVTFRRELTVKSKLDEAGIECFVPMQRKVKVVKGRKVSVMEPVIHNLIFVHAARKDVHQFKSQVSYLQYMTRRNETKNEPIIVPEWQMNDFIKVSTSAVDNLIYLDSNEMLIEKGTPVRIHGGSFDGVTGTFVKIKGKRSRKIVLTIQDVVSVAIDVLSYNYLEILE